MAAHRREARDFCNLVQRIVLRKYKTPLYILAFIVIYSLSASALLYGLFEFPFNTFRGYEIYQYILHYTTNEAPWGAKAKVIAAAVIPLFVILGTVAMFLFKPKQIYGDSRWATLSEIGSNKLFSKNGVILGRSGGKFITSDAPTHTLLVAPTRSGKGVGVVIPNCLTWQGSLVCLDVKTENFQITSGFRQKYGHKVFLWSPMAQDKKSARFNPLDMVSKDEHHRISDLQIIAALLVSVSDKDPMWGNEARSLFIGAALAVIDDPDQPSTLGAVYRFLSTSEDLLEVCKLIVENTPNLDPAIERALGSFASKAPKEASGVKNSLLASLRIFENPVVDAATSNTDFDLRDLRRKRMSIYVGVLPSQLETLAPLLRLFFQQVIAIMSSSQPGKDEPHKVLMLLDEFPSIGAMDSVVNAFTLLAGYHVRVMAIIQGISWIDKNYDKDTREGLIANCAHQIFFATNDETTSKYVSDALGETTKKQTSYMKNPLAPTVTKGTKTISVTGRPLLMPQEVRRLDPRKAIIINEGTHPILCNKIRYYEMPVFKKRLLEPATVRDLDMRRVPQVSYLPKDSENSIDLPSAAKIAPLPVEPGSPFVTSDDIANDETQIDALQQIMAIFETEAKENPDFDIKHISNITDVFEAGH